MKTFQVFNHPTIGYLSVKQGFSWPAFFFTWIWAFTKKMWMEGIIFIIAMIVLVLVEKLFEMQGIEGGTLLMIFAQIGLFIVYGAKGNEWWKNEILKRGFTQVKTVIAETSDAAIASVAAEVGHR